MGYETPSSTATLQRMALALNEIIQEIRLFYQPPNSVTTAEEARVWIDRFKQTLADETSDPAELLDGWRDFRRQHTRGFWPTPGAVCETIRERRRSRRAYEPEPRPQFEALPPPPKGKRWSQLTPEERAAHEERVKRCLAELNATTTVMKVSNIAARNHARKEP